MTKVTIRTILLYLSALLIFSGIESCKKSDPPAPKSKTTLLTQGSWKTVKEETKTGTGAWIDVTGSIQACDKDNIFIFRTNTTFEENEGATKCNPGDPQIIGTGNWSFGNNETQLNLTPTGFPPPFRIYSLDQLDESTLMVTYTYTIGGITYYERSTVGH